MHIALPDAWEEREAAGLDFAAYSLEDSVDVFGRNITLKYEASNGLPFGLIVADIRTMLESMGYVIDSTSNYSISVSNQRSNLAVTKFFATNRMSEPEVSIKSTIGFVMLQNQAVVITVSDDSLGNAIRPVEKDFDYILSNSTY